MPRIATRTSGNRQYPSTEAERGYVREEEKCELPRWSWSWFTCSSAAERGGDIKERIVWRSIVPRTARPANR